MLFNKDTPPKRLTMSSAFIIHLESQALSLNPQKQDLAKLCSQSYLQHHALLAW